MFYKDARQVYRAEAFDGFDWLDHGFGTRQSGSWVEGPLVTVRQIHSAVCIAVDGCSGCAGKGDGLFTATPGHYLAIRTADCLPILIADQNKKAVAAVHAGWRGTAAEIAVKAVESMRARLSSHAEDLVVAIGPGICGRCYAVGPEVAGRFQRWLPERSDLGGSTTIDLAEVNRRQFIAAGVPPERIHLGAPCTFCAAGEFHSYRRSPDRPGRMLSAVAVMR